MRFASVFSSYSTAFTPRLSYHHVFEFCQALFQVLNFSKSVLLLILQKVDRLKLLFIPYHFIIDRRQLVGGRHDGVLLSAFGFFAPEITAQPVVTFLHAISRGTKGLACGFGSFFISLLLISFPPDILLLGHRFSQETKCFSVDHLLRSVPVSASISNAPTSLKP